MYPSVIVFGSFDKKILKQQCTAGDVLVDIVDDGDVLQLIDGEVEEQIPKRTIFIIYE